MSGRWCWWAAPTHRGWRKRTTRSPVGRCGTGPATRPFGGVGDQEYLVASEGGQRRGRDPFIQAVQPAPGKPPEIGHDLVADLVAPRARVDRPFSLHERLELIAVSDGQPDPPAGPHRFTQQVRQRLL